ncbi:dTDP-4-dehydrorhamnose 3,5-epimerase [candidate division KSB1 bacterium]|nr:MAG: dTDP-4-dehydrorhamnose 3,5-epimerase [candidate division KSB1 bacterium]
MINGVKIKKLKVIPDERGRLMEILRCDDEMFSKFGQVYMTTTYPRVIKGWHYHKIQDDHITAISGMIKLVIYDMREDSPTRGELNEFFIGEHNLCIVKVPKGVVHGWKCISLKEAIIINVVTEPYNYENPDEYRIPYNDKSIPYNWDIVMR